VADQRQHVERLLDVALYAPLGLALTVRDRLPRRLRQSRQAIENRVQLARFVGELAVRYGRNEVERERLERQAAASNGHVSEPVDAESVPATGDEAVTETLDATVDASTAAGEPVIPVPAAEAPNVDPGPSAETLPIGDYESLAAIHVVQRLGSLRADEIDQIRRFEAAHRARRTILAKIAQLQDAAAS
jgi:hypothetical protein